MAVMPLVGDKAAALTSATVGLQVICGTPTWMEKFSYLPFNN